MCFTVRWFFGDFALGFAVGVEGKVSLLWEKSRNTINYNVMTVQQ